MIFVSHPTTGQRWECVGLEYLRALQLLAKGCTFVDVRARTYRDELIRDSFVMVFKNPSIRQRLLENDDIDLQSAAWSYRQLRTRSAAIRFDALCGHRPFTYWQLLLLNFTPTIRLKRVKVPAWWLPPEPRNQNKKQNHIVIFVEDFLTIGSFALRESRTILAAGNEDILHKSALGVFNNFFYIDRHYWNFRNQPKHERFSHISRQELKRMTGFLDIEHMLAMAMTQRSASELYLYRLSRNVQSSCTFRIVHFALDKTFSGDSYIHRNDIYFGQVPFKSFQNRICCL